MLVDDWKLSLEYLLGFSQKTCESFHQNVEENAKGDRATIYPLTGRASVSHHGHAGRA